MGYPDPVGIPSKSPVRRDQPRTLGPPGYSALPQVLLERKTLLGQAERGRFTGISAQHLTPHRFTFHSKGTSGLSNGHAGALA